MGNAPTFFLFFQLIARIVFFVSALCCSLNQERIASAAWIRPSTRATDRAHRNGNGNGKDRKKDERNDERNRERAKLKPIALIKNHRLIYCTTLHQLGG